MGVRERPDLPAERGLPNMAQHPLEPLSRDEFRQTASILRREGLVRDTFRFASIELKEPPKGEVKAWRPGNATRRTSFAVVFNREDNKTYEATVGLPGVPVVSFEHIPGVPPNFTLDEFHDVDVAMRQPSAAHQFQQPALPR